MHCDAMIYTHNNVIAHCDITMDVPSNIIMTLVDLPKSQNVNKSTWSILSNVDVQCM